MWWALPRPIGRWVSDCQLAEGEFLPRGYGIAWYLPYSARAYCLPIPLNSIAGAFRAWWLQLRRPCADDPIANAYADGHSIGFSEGSKHGELHTARLMKVWLHEESQQ